MSARRPGRSARFTNRASGSPARGVQLRRERKPEDRRVRNVRHLTSFVHLSQPTTGGEALRSIKNSHLRQTQNVCDTEILSRSRGRNCAAVLVRRPMRPRLNILLTVLLLGIFVAAPARAGTGMFVGAAEDESRKLDPLAAKSKLDLAAVAGLGTIRMTSIWSPGETVLRGDELIALQNASTAAQFDGVRLIVSIYPRDRRTTPLNARARGEFAEYAASVARLVPGVKDFIVGNEPNLNLFWMPQFGAGGRDLAAPAYELLLAKTYDALKSVSPDINVIGGALSPRGQDKAERRAADAFADRVHQRPRPRVSQVRPHASDHGHVRAASVPDPVEAAPGLRASEHDDDRARRLPEARRVADDSVRTHRAGRRDVADHLRRVRLPDARADAEALALHAPRNARRAGCDHRAAPGALLPAGDRDRALPADRRRDADLPRHRRARRERVAVGRLLPGRHAEDEHGRAPLGRARGAGRNGRAVREAEDREQLRERRLPPAPGRAGAAADRPDVRVGVHLHARG